jgi:hypothetical protein
MPKKPTLRIAPGARYEYDLQERLVRRLQDSPLHVFGVCVLSAVPAELGGDPDDPHTSMMVTLTLLTDGRRGWLVLVDEAPEVDMAAEMTELLGELVAGREGVPPFLVREATRWSPPTRARTLDLRDPAAVRPTVEAAFEEALPEGARADVEGFLACFAPFNFRVQDELALRRFVAGNDADELAS